MTAQRSAAFDLHTSDSDLCRLRAEYRAIAPNGDMGSYMAWLENQVIGLRETLITVQAGYQALERSYSRLSSEVHTETA